MHWSNGNNCKVEYLVQNAYKTIKVGRIYLQKLHSQLKSLKRDDCWKFIFKQYIH